MRLRTTAAVLAATALASAAAASPAISAGRASTTLTIQAEQDGFSGFVKSKRQGCHSGRTVTLFRKAGRSAKRAGSDVAQPNQDGSQWKISVSRSGSYYAVVKATSKCAGKTSATRTIRLGEGASAAQGDDDGPALVRIVLRRGVGDYRKGVVGRVISANPDCVTDRTVTIYRRKLGVDGNSIVETKAGTSTVKQLPNVKPKNFNFAFGLVRSGSVIAKISATDDCKAARSRPYSYTRPL